MKRIFGWVLVAGITLVFCGHAIAAGGKIGYLDVTGAAAKSNWGKKVSDDLKKDRETLAAAVQQKNQAFVTARDDYMKKKTVMDEKARTKKEEELRTMGEELQKLASESESKWNEQKNASMAPIFKRIMEIAEKISKDEKYEFILDRNAIIVPGSDKDDITSRVATELDKTAHK